MSNRLTSERIVLTDSAQDINAEFFQKGWTDGLPIIRRLKQMWRRWLAGTSRQYDEIVAVIPPRWGEATVEKIAINAVMAGCLPEYLPLIVTSVEAMCEAVFNLDGMQTTTYPVAFVWIVNGQ